MQRHGSSTAVTVLGLGAMGTAIAATLAGRSHPTTVWNRSPATAPAGTRSASSLTAAVAASPVTLVSVLDDHAARQTLTAAGDALKGRAVVNLTSCTPAQARDTAIWLTARDADYLDGSVMADPNDIGTDQTTLLYSGSKAIFKTHRDLLEALGTTRFLGDDPGRAAAVFMALVSVGYETWIAYLDTLAYGQAEDLRATDLAPHVTSMFSAMTDLLTGMARATDDGRHPPAAGPLAVHAALMDDVIEARQAAGGDSSQLRRVKRLVDRRVADGHGHDGFSSLIETLESQERHP